MRHRHQSEPPESQTMESGRNKRAHASGGKISRARMRDRAVRRGRIALKRTWKATTHGTGMRTRPERPIKPQHNASGGKSNTSGCAAACARSQEFTAARPPHKARSATSSAHSGPSRPRRASSAGRAHPLRGCRHRVRTGDNCREVVAGDAPSDNMVQSEYVADLSSTHPEHRRAARGADIGPCSSASSMRLLATLLGLAFADPRLSHGKRMIFGDLWVPWRCGGGE